MWNRAGFFDEAGGMMYGGKGKRKGKNSKNMIKYLAIILDKYDIRVKSNRL